MVHVRVPALAPRAAGMAKVLQGLHGYNLGPFTPSARYELVGSLREHYGIDAILHFGYRHGAHSHKIEILDSGEKTLQQMADVVTDVFDVDPWSLGLMRVDLTADVQGVPVPWFRDHSFVSRKQFSSRIENSNEHEIRFVGMAKGEAQTLYAGKRPNLIRIYNKVAELRLQHRKLESDCRRFNARMRTLKPEMVALEMSAEQMYYGSRIPPTFEEFCKTKGFHFSKGEIVTRIERQIGGGRFPPELATLNDLRFVHELTPFKELQLVSKGPIQQLGPPPEDVSMRNYLASIGLSTLQQAFGSAQLAHSFVLRFGKGNGKRILESLADCFPVEREFLAIEEVQESFKHSTLLQTSHSARWGVHLSPTYEHTKQITGSRFRILPQEGPYRWTAASRKSDRRTAH